MDLGDTDVLALAQKRLSWLDARQAVLARNVANADTPGWQPRDVGDFAQMLAGTGGTGLALTQPHHLPGVATGSAGAVKERPAARAPDGNAVSLDVQLMKVADTETNQEAVTGLFSKYLGLFRLALGRTQ